MTAAFGICAAVLGPRRERRRHVPGRLHDRRAVDLDGGSRPPAAAGTTDSGVTPGYGLFATADGGQVALGVVDEQHFWDALCAALGLGALVGLDFEERTRRGAELQRAVGVTIAARERDQLVAELVAAGVPVAPVLDRAEHAGDRPVPQLPDPAAPAPTPSRSSRPSTSTADRASASDADARSAAAILLRCAGP